MSGQRVAVVTAVFNGPPDSDPRLVLGPLPGRSVLVEVGYRMMLTDATVPVALASVEVALVLADSGRGAREDVANGQSLIDRGGAVKVEGKFSFNEYPNRNGSAPSVFPFFRRLGPDSAYVLVALEGATADPISIFAWAVAEAWPARGG